MLLYIIRSGHPADNLAYNRTEGSLRQPMYQLCFYLHCTTFVREQLVATLSGDG